TDAGSGRYIRNRQGIDHSADRTHRPAGLRRTLVLHSCWKTQGTGGGTRMSDKLRVLVISHAHPSISLGGGEIASYNLHKGLNSISDVQSVYLARAAHPIPRHGTTALMSMRRASDEILFHADEYDHF